MAHLHAVGVKVLPLLDITKVTNSNELTPACGSYGAYTLHTAIGEFVLWTSHGEINLSEVIKD